jgi:hypothetical protein
MIDQGINILRKGLGVLTALRATKGGPMGLVRWGFNSFMYRKFMRRMFWRK